MTKVLSEGLREGDLADLVLPLISVDEYVSTIDPSEAIVVGFYVQDESAAKDLNRFIQRSAIPLLGTDVSPAPDQHGYFMVFVEILDNERLGENLQAILEEIHGLVNIDDWHMRVRATDHVLPFSPEELQKALARAKHANKKAEVVEYLQPSLLLNAEFEDSLIVLEGGGNRFVFDFVGFDTLSKLLHEHRLDGTAVGFDLRSVAKTNKIKRMLGERWEASQIGGYVLLHTGTDPRALLLRL